MFIRKTITPVITSDVYTANDCVGDILEYELGLGNSRNLSLKSVVLTDADAEKAKLVLFLFTQAPTYSGTMLDHDPFTPVAADLAKIAGNVTIAAADYEDVDSGAVATKETDLPIVLAPGETVVYAQLVADATPTYTAVNDLVLTLTFEL